MSNSTPTEWFDEPTDLSAIKRERALFFLAGYVPIDPANLATHVTQSPETVQDVLKQRFEGDIDFDATGFLRLTDAARAPILRAGKSRLEAATESMTAGEESYDENELEAAAAEFEVATEIGRGVRTRFSAVNYQPAQLDKFITTAAQRHDDAQKEATKDTIRSLLTSAMEYEANGDSQTDPEAGVAQAAYHRAEIKIKDAIACAEAYNGNRLSEESSRLAIDKLRTRLKSLREKIVKPSTETDTEPSGTASTPPDVAEDELLDELRAANERLSRLPLPSDFRDGHDYEPAAYRDRFGSWDDALEAAGIDKRAHLEAEIRRLSDDADGTVSREQMAEDGQYSATFITDEYDSWDVALDAADVNTPSHTGGSSPDAAGSDSSYGGPEWTDDSEQADSTADETETEQDYPQLEEPAFSSSWETIPDNERLSNQFLFLVVRVRDPRGDKKTHVLDIEDRTGTDLTMDIWKTHNLSYEWTANHWYAVSNARGSVWEAKDGETMKRLSSTKDLEVIHLGTDFDPLTAEGSHADSTNTTSTADTATTESPASKSTSTADTATAESPSADSTSNSEQSDSSSSDDDLFDDIVSEFDEI